MNTTNKSPEQETTDLSSINRLPDEIILQILNKLLDLKTLCYCHLVSKRFSSIILQVTTISFIAPLITSDNNTSTNVNTTGDINTTGFRTNLFRSLINDVVLKPIHLLRRILLPSSRPLPPIISSFYGDSFRSAVSFLSRFTSVKSLLIQLPSSSHKGIDNNCLFKWNAVFGNRIESFVFLSPDSVYNSNELFINPNFEENEYTDHTEYMEPSSDSFKRKVHIAFQCLKDVIMRQRMLLYFVKDHPHLEKVWITDSAKRGALCLSGGKLDEVKGWMSSAGDDAKLKMSRIDVPVNVSQCYVPVLSLPVSGCVMKGVTVVVMQMDRLRETNDWFVNGGDGFEDEVEAAYSEAVTEILVKMKRLL